MTAPPSPPNRRRRRLVVILAALVLVSNFSWWYWPRGDARFVGKWTLSEVSNGQEVPVGWIDFRSNGSVLASIYQPSNFWPVSWRIEGNDLFINDPFSDFPDWFSRTGTWFRRRLTTSLEPIGGRMSFQVKRVEYEIIEVTIDLK